MTVAAAAMVIDYVKLLENKNPFGFELMGAAALCPTTIFLLLLFSSASFLCSTQWRKVMKHVSCCAAWWLII